MMREFRDTPLSLQEVAQEVGAGTLLQGELSWSGGELRMEIRLLDGSLSVPLWEESYRGTIREVLDLQGEVAVRVGLEVGAVLSVEEFSSPGRPASRSMDAYRPYLRSRALSGTDATLADLMVEEHLLQQAIFQDPAFSEAWSALGWNYLRRVEEHAQARTFADSALVAAQTALSHNPASAEAHMVMGWVYVQEGFLRRGEESFTKALEEDGNLAQAFFLRGKARIALGRFDEAIHDFERALVRDSRGPGIRSFIGAAYAYLTDLDSAEWWTEREMEGMASDTSGRSHLEAVRLRWRGDIEGAFRVGLKMVDAAPESPRMRLFLAELALQAGKCEESIEHARTAVAMSSVPTGLRSTFFASTLLGMARQACGQRAPATELLSESREFLLSKVEEGSQDPITFLELAAVYESMEDRETAVVWMEKAFQAGFRHIRFLDDFPVFESLRSDPEVGDLLDGIRQEIRSMLFGLRNAEPMLEEEALQIASLL
jgi:tetratricopeptide (TPR) repeat protein